MKTTQILLHALSPLHAGTGQGVGVIDLPIAREKATGIPFVPGSSLKGVLRAACEEEQVRTRVFGPDSSAADAHAGAVSVSDLRLLLLPVRSLRGTFAWVSSPLLLRRLVRDARMSGIKAFQLKVPDVGEEACLVAAKANALARDNGQVILEDLVLESAGSAEVSGWGELLAEALFTEDDSAWQEYLKPRLCLVSDNVMGYLLEMCTEVSARIGLAEDTKTVRTGALWYEEALPAETVLAGLVTGQDVEGSGARAEEVVQTVSDLSARPVQVGGSATVGRGLCRLRVLEAE